MSNIKKNIISSITVLPKIDIERSFNDRTTQVFGLENILDRIENDVESKLHISVEIVTLGNNLIQSSQSPITNIEFITPVDNFFGETFGEINEESSGGNDDDDDDDDDAGNGEQESEFENVNIAIAPKEYPSTQPYSERGPTRITVTDNNSDIIIKNKDLLSVSAIQTNNVENPVLEDLTFEAQQDVENDQRSFSLSFTPPPLLDRLIDGTIEYEVSYNAKRSQRFTDISGVIGTITQSIKAYEKPEETKEAEQEDFGNPDLNTVAATIKTGLENFLIKTLGDTPPDIDNIEIIQPESQRYFKYAINDDSGSFKPILNWVQGGELSQVNNEIDVLDSIVLKFADPVSQQLSKLDTVTIYNSRIDGLQYEIDYSEDIADEDRISLRPNFKTEILTDKVNQVSRSKNFDEITTSGVTNDIIDYFKRKEKVNLNVDYTDFKNFIKFSSAEERIRNFIYNVQAIETLNSASAAIDDYDISAQSKQLEKTKLANQKREIVNRFDAYDTFLYTDSGSIYESLFVSSSEQIPASWPKESGSTLKLSTDSEVKSWVTSIIEIAKDYDNLNRDSFRNNTPEFIREDLDSSDYVLFVDMIGQLFDFVYLHVNELSKLYEWTDDIAKGLSSDLSFIMLSAFISEIDVGFSDKDIWEYILGTTKSGEDIGGLDTKFSFERQQKNTIRRLLTNLPYLLKHKGTRAGIKGLVKSYGIPESTLSITEFGNIQTDEGVEENSNTVITNTFKLEIPKSSNKNIFFSDELIPPVKAIEFNYQWDKTDSQPNEVTFMSGTNPDNSDENFNIKLVPTTDTSGQIHLTINSGSVSTEISSSEAPIFNESFWNVLVQQNSEATYQIYLNDFNRQQRVFDTQAFDATFIDQTEALGFDPAFNNSYDIFVGNDGTANTFYGYLDELRIWSEPLSQTDFDEHTKFPSSVRLDDPLKIPSALKVRVDIDKEPSDDSINNNTLPNLVFNPLYETNVSSSNVNSSDFKPIERDDIVLSPVIGTEKQTDNKVRYPNPSNKLSSPTLTVPVDNNSNSAEIIPDITDTNDLVIGFSPTQIVDQIILQHFGSTDLIDKYGDPTEADSEEYNALATFVENFFENINSNYKVKFFIEYIKNFDKTLFNNIEKFVPEKANLSTSIFIEPHVLDRSKAKKIGNISELIDLANQGNSALAGPGGAILEADFNTSETTEETSISVIDSTERFLGEFYNITLGNNASLIISADEIDSLLNQNTRIILLKDGFIEQLLENIRPVDALDGELVFRVRNKFNEVFVFEFRKFDFILKIEELISQISNLTDGTEEYDILAAQIKQLQNLNQNLFLIKYPFDGDKPGIPATFEDFAELVRTIIGEGAIVGDTIVINGRTYAVDPDGDSVVETFESDGVACIKIEERSDGVSLTVE